MHTLHQILRILCHIIAQVVETKLIVGTKGDICHICFAASLAIRLMFVNTVDAHAMEHINGAHPLRVTLGQIVVHSYHMNAITSKGIQEDGKCSCKGLTFTREHLGYLTLM